MFWSCKKLDKRKRQETSICPIFHKTETCNKELPATDLCTYRCITINLVVAEFDFIDPEIESTTQCNYSTGFWVCCQRPGDDLKDIQTTSSHNQTLISLIKHKHPILWLKPHQSFYILEMSTI